ncbi:bifunctional nuclease family protein [bacterium]|nr:bifunctional nuclease family protein [bacterium]MBU4362152.1 bifunctional nuclease family protein [bacterium]MBU4602232.1 bifunctional nuclease family protein [bacterium]MCG2762340.1 bifunctional nuclease family protein [Candidatus Atribacteria bacterium]
MIRVKISGVAIDPVTKGFVVILKDETEKRWLPIWVGHYEAKMISLALEKVKPVRPLAHDLVKNILDSLGVVVTRVVICDIKDNTYFASVRLKINQTEKEIDARPSDAIALALRAGAPIYVTEEVLNKASTEKITLENEKEIKLAELQQKMEKAIEVENYEEAAKLRDKIRSLEKK